MLLQSLLRPVLTPLMRGMFDAPIASSTEWSPLALWPDGIASPGMWISPRTLDSEWQDYTGTTPVSVPGTVADSANPVGLALDIRAGAPEVLGPELVTNGDFAAGATGWTLEGEWTVGSGQASITNASNVYAIYQTGVTEGKTYLASFNVTSLTSGGFNFCCGVRVVTVNATSVGLWTAILVCGPNGIMGVCANSLGTTGSIDNISFKEVPGLHMLQSTSAARPLLSAYAGQTLGPGNTYDSTGYPIFQLYDGVDDGMATAAFSAGTLIDGMDCMIVVRRDSAAPVVAGLYTVPVRGRYFGHAQSGSGGVCYSNVGTPTTWVDGAQLTGGTSVTADTLNTALSTGSWHIMEFQGLGLSIWTKYAIGEFGSGFSLTGDIGDILLYPSTASTEDKDAARQWLADYYGVTLP